MTVLQDTVMVKINGKYRIWKKNKRKNIKKKIKKKKHDFWFMILYTSCCNLESLRHLSPQRVCGPLTYINLLMYSHHDFKHSPVLMERMSCSICRSRRAGPAQCDPQHRHHCPNVLHLEGDRLVWGYHIPTITSFMSSCLIGPPRERR